MLDIRVAHIVWSKDIDYRGVLIEMLFIKIVCCWSYESSSDSDKPLNQNVKITVGCNITHLMTLCWELFSKIRKLRLTVISMFLLSLRGLMDKPTRYFINEILFGLVLDSVIFSETFPLESLPLLPIVQAIIPKVKSLRKKISYL